MNNRTSFDQGNTDACEGTSDPFDVSQLQQQLEEISLAAAPSADTPMHHFILTQINTRLAQIHAINTVTGGAYDDVCRLYRDVSVFACSAISREKQAAKSLGRLENLEIHGNQLEDDTWDVTLSAREQEWIFHEAVRDWAAMTEAWVLAVSCDMDKLNARVYQLSEELTVQKTRIERLHDRMRREAQGGVEELAGALEACSIELEIDEKAINTTENFNIPMLCVPILHYMVDSLEWTEDVEIEKVALEARRLYDTALDIERRVYL